MRNNKNIQREEIKVGMRIKMRLPTWYALTNRTRLKKYSWRKGKVVSVHKTGAFTVYLGYWIGSIFVCSNQEYRMVECLKRRK